MFYYSSVQLLRATYFPCVTLLREKKNVIAKYNFCSSHVIILKITFLSTKGKKKHAQNQLLIILCSYL